MMIQKHKFYISCHLARTVPGYKSPRIDVCMHF